MDNTQILASGLKPMTYLLWDNSATNHCTTTLLAFQLPEMQIKIRLKANWITNQYG